MARKRYRPEEIAAKLRQVDVQVSQGQAMADAIRQIVNSDRLYLFINEHNKTGFAQYIDRSANIIRYVAGLSDPPPLKWSDLRYVFDIKEDCNGKEAIQA